MIAFPSNKNFSEQNETYCSKKRKRASSVTRYKCHTGTERERKEERKGEKTKEKGKEKERKQEKERKKERGKKNWKEKKKRERVGCLSVR